MLELCRGLPTGSIKTEQEKKNTGLLEAGGYFIKTWKAHSSTTKKECKFEELSKSVCL